MNCSPVSTGSSRYLPPICYSFHAEPLVIVFPSSPSNRHAMKSHWREHRHGLPRICALHWISTEALFSQSRRSLQLNKVYRLIKRHGRLVFRPIKESTMFRFRRMIVAFVALAALVALVTVFTPPKPAHAATASRDVSTGRGGLRWSYWQPLARG